MVLPAPLKPGDGPAAALGLAAVATDADQAGVEAHADYGTGAGAGEREEDFMSETLDMSESRKTRLCLQWIDCCRSMGWNESAIAELVDLFWKHEGWRTFRGAI